MDATELDISLRVAPLRPVDASTVVLGIETSCDETAAALVMGGRDVVSSVVSSQVDLHAAYGGVVPEIASRAHLELLNPVIAAAVVEAGVTESRIDAVACTVGPGLIGALLVGVAGAKALALTWGVPFVAVNHLEAHLYAAFLEEPELELPFVALLVSGGHTMLIEMVDHGRYRLLGQTIDDAAGEAFDKVARFLGLGYPGGPAIDRAAVHGDPRAIAFPRAMLHDGLDFSFSGLKTAVVNHVRAHPDVRHRARGRQLPAGRRRCARPQGHDRGPRGRRQGAGARRWRRRQLALADARAGGLRARRPALPAAQPGHVHRQRGHDRGDRLVPAAVGRAEPAGHRRRPQPAPAALAVSRCDARSSGWCAGMLDRP